MNSRIVNKLKKDKYYFLASFILIILIILLFIFRENFIHAVDVHLTSLKIFGNYYDLNIFDGIMFTAFIIITMVTAWYFGGHAAFMFVSISWNFEVALFIVLTGRYELIVEFVNLFVFIALYFIESPADKKARIQRQIIEATNKQLIQTNKVFERFVPKEFISLIGKNCMTELSSGDSIQQKITVVFIDIRNFSKYTQNINPREIFDFINSFLKEVGPIIRKHNGIIDKYLGDGLMALFPSNPTNAVNCAIEISSTIKKFNENSKCPNFTSIKIGTGIHIGVSILGAIGEEERIETTVISEAVNISSRIEELTKTYGVEVIITKDLYNEIKNKNDYYIRLLDEVYIKGTDFKCKIYEVITNTELPLSQSKIKYKDEFEKGVDLVLSNKFNDALSVFKNLCILSPNDYPIKYHVAKCKQYMQACE